LSGPNPHFTSRRASSYVRRSAPRERTLPSTNRASAVGSGRPSSYSIRQRRPGLWRSTRTERTSRPGTRASSSGRPRRRPRTTEGSRAARRKGLPSSAAAPNGSMTRAITGMGSGRGGRDPRARAPAGVFPLACEQLPRELLHPVEAAQVHIVAPGPSDVVGDPGGDGTGCERFRVEQVDKPAIPEALGADELLAARRDPGHDQRAFAERQRFADRVVATHADQASGARHQVGGLTDEVDDGERAIVPGQRVSTLTGGGVHVRAAHDHAPDARGGPGEGERLGQTVAVLASADGAQRKGAFRQRVLDGGRRPVPQTLTLVEIAQIGELAPRG